MSEPRAGDASPEEMQTQKTVLTDFFLGTEDRILLAPMEGVVDAVMRDQLTRIGGIDLCVTEFIRVTDRLLPLNDYKKYCPELFNGSGSRTSADTLVLVQLLGGQPGPMAENAAFASSLGAPGIDLNFGCPAKTVNRHDGGASLLKQPSRIHDVVSAVRKATPSHLTVSAKVRLGFEHKEFHREIALAAESGGASWLTVHARTRDEGYRPPAHWEYIANMRESIRIPVIANGEIWTIEDYHRARAVSGCRHVMIGRGLMSRPDLALAIKCGAAHMSWSELAPLVIEFGDASRDFKHDHYAVCRVKQWLKSLAKHHTEAISLFGEIKTFESWSLMREKIAANIATHPLSIGSSLPSRSSAARSV